MHVANQSNASKNNGAADAEAPAVLNSNVNNASSDSNNKAITTSVNSTSVESSCISDSEDDNRKKQIENVKKIFDRKHALCPIDLKPKKTLILEDFKAASTKCFTCNETVMVEFLNGAFYFDCSRCNIHGVKCVESGCAG